MTTSETMLIYASIASHPFSAADLRELLVTARSRNHRAGITGLLLHIDGAFLQVLEGRRETVHALYAVIRHDPRHTGAYVLIDTPIARRSFGDWSMGYAGMTRAELAVQPGLSDFFLRDDPLTALPPGLAQAIVRGFVDGTASQPVQTTGFPR